MRRTDTTTGAKFTVRGQVYVQTGHFYHTMGNDREVRVLKLQTSCPECSQPFEVTASMRQISTRQCDIRYQLAGCRKNLAQARCQIDVRTDDFADRSQAQHWAEARGENRRCLRHRFQVREWQLGHAGDRCEIHDGGIGFW